MSAEPLNVRVARALGWKHVEQRTDDWVGVPPEWQDSYLPMGIIYMTPLGESKC